MWHVLRMEAGQEKLSADLYSACPVYIPHKIERRFNRRHRSWRTYRSVLFPGYVFVNMTCPSDNPVPPNRHVRGFLRNGDGSYAIVRDAALKALRSAELEGQAHAIDTAGPTSKFQPGQVAEIMSGRLTGMKAIVALIHNEKELEVELTSLPGYKVVLKADRLRATAA